MSSSVQFLTFVNNTNREASRRWHEVITVEDMLLGVLGAGDEVTAICAEYGLTLRTAREAAEARHGELLAQVHSERAELPTKDYRQIHSTDSAARWPDSLQSLSVKSQRGKNFHCSMAYRLLDNDSQCQELAKHVGVRLDDLVAALRDSIDAPR